MDIAVALAMVHKCHLSLHLHFLYLNPKILPESCPHITSLEQYLHSACLACAFHLCYYWVSVLNCQTE